MSRPPHLLPPAAGEEPERSPLGDIRSHPVPCRTCSRLTWNHSATCAACRRKAAEDQ